MKILVFEDSKCKNLSPVTLLRASFDIKPGIYSNLEKITKLLPADTEVFLSTRKSLETLTKERQNYNVNNFPAGDYLLLNGKINFSRKSFNDIILKLKENTLLVSGETLIAGNVKLKENSNTFGINDFKDCEKIELEQNSGIYIFEYTWDIVKFTKEILTDDLKIYFNEHITEVFAENSGKANSSDNVLISQSAKVFPNVVFDASSGDIAVDENAVIEPFTFIKGPAYIGKTVLIKSGTKIYGPCSFGIHSRVSGEISGTVFHGYSNKQHDGFIGNSYVCEFVNLGADTVTSNLKNNYSKIKARFSADERQYHTNMQFFGTVFGDHTKTGINTMLNTGSIIGIFAIIAGGGFPDKFIDSFTWYISGKLPAKYKIAEALETAKVVMSRRDVELTPAYEKLVREVYESFLTISIV